MGPSSTQGSAVLPPGALVLVRLPLLGHVLQGASHIAVESSLLTAEAPTADGVGCVFLGAPSEDFVRSVRPLIGLVKLLVSELVEIVEVTALVDGLNGNLLLLDLCIFLQVVFVNLTVVLSKDLLIQQSVVELSVVNALQNSGGGVALLLFLLVDCLQLCQQLFLVELLLRNKLLQLLLKLQVVLVISII